MTVPWMRSRAGTSGSPAAQGAVSDLPSALNALAFVRLLAGDLAAADSLAQEAQTIAEAAGSRAAPYSALGVAAVRGREEAARALIDRTWQDAALRGEGLGMAAAKWATAVLHNGLGRYAEALSAAEEAIEHAGPPAVAGWPMAELIEAAARTGQPGRATRIMRSLSQSPWSRAPTGPSGSGLARWRC